MTPDSTERMMNVVRIQLAHAKAAEDARDQSRTEFHEWLAVEWLALAVSSQITQ